MRLAKFLAVGLAGACVLLAKEFEAGAQSVPHVSGYTLSGDPISLPQRGRGVSLLVLSFGGLGEPEAAPWRVAAGRLGIPHLTVLVMGERGRMARATVSGSLRADAGKDAPRDLIVPVYADPVLVRSSLGLRPTSSLQVVIADGEGRVLASIDGPWTREGEAALREQLVAPRPELAVVAEAASPGVAPAALPALAGAPVQPVEARPAPMLPPAAQTTTEAVASPMPASGSRAGAATAVVSAPSESGLTAPVRATANRPGALAALMALTLSGERREVPGSAGVLVIASSAREVQELTEALRRLDAEGGCGTGCLGLVAMGSNAFPSRAVATGRVRGDVEDLAMRARIAPVYESHEALLQRFAPDSAGGQVTVVVLRGSSR